MRTTNVEKELKLALIQQDLKNGLTWSAICQKRKCSNRLVAQVAAQRANNIAQCNANFQMVQDDILLIRKAFKECWTKRPNMKYQLQQLMARQGWY